MNVVRLREARLMALGFCLLFFCNVDAGSQVMCNLILFCFFKNPSWNPDMLQEFVPTEKLRGKSKSLISARRRAGAAEGRRMERWLYLDLSAGFEANTQETFPFPHPQPSPDARPRKIAGRTAVDLKQVQALFTASNWDSLWIFPWAEEPQATARGRNNCSRWVPGQDRGEPSWLLPSWLGTRQVKLNPGLHKTPQPTDNSTQVSKISNNNE